MTGGGASKISVYHDVVGPFLPENQKVSESIRYQGRVSFALEMSTTVLYLAILRHFSAISGLEIQKFVRNAQFPLPCYQFMGKWSRESVLLPRQKTVQNFCICTWLGHINFLLWSRSTTVCNVAEHLDNGENGLSKSHFKVSLTTFSSFGVGLKPNLGWVSWTRRY